MAVSKALRRLLKIRDLEEEQQRLALESALGDLQRLEISLQTAQAGERRGRELFESSVYTGEVIDRQAGLVETVKAHEDAARLASCIAALETQAALLRRQFLEKRVERMQAETLIGETELSDAIAADRRGQQSLDDWYGSRKYREAEDAQSDSDVSAKEWPSSEKL